MERGSSPSFRRRPESGDLKDGIGCLYNYGLISKSFRRKPESRGSPDACPGMPKSENRDPVSRMAPGACARPYPGFPRDDDWTPVFTGVTTLTKSPHLMCAPKSFGRRQECRRSFSFVMNKSLKGLSQTGEKRGLPDLPFFCYLFPNKARLQQRSEYATKSIREDPW